MYNSKRAEKYDRRIVKFNGEDGKGSSLYKPHILTASPHLDDGKKDGKCLSSEDDGEGLRKAAPCGLLKTNSIRYPKVCNTLAAHLFLHSTTCCCQNGHGLLKLLYSFEPECVFLEQSESQLII